MALPIIPLLAACALLSLSIYRFIVHPGFLSPLAKIPNAHWSAPFTRLWILFHRYSQNETPTVHDAHRKHGPIIRLAPKEISVNSVDGGIRTIYAGGFEKGDWYYNIFSNYDVMPMFAMPDHSHHSKRKRMLSNIYAKSTLHSSQALERITRILLKDRLIPRIEQLSQTGKPIEFYDIFSAVTMDFVSSYVFGLKNGGDYVQQPDMGRKFFVDYKARQKYGFWAQDLPIFTRLMKTIGLKGLLVPAWVDQANRNIEALTLNMCDNAETTLRKIEVDGDDGKVENYPTVYAQIRNALLKEAFKGDFDVSKEQKVQKQRLDVASEMLDHTLAGFDTSSITLTFLAWELSRPENRAWQERLRAEVSKSPDNEDPKTVDTMPVLQAILMETLRLHAAIPGNQPRITPSSATLGPPGHSVTGLPAAVRVQSQAWSLHRNPDVFPDPESWRPERWLEASAAQQQEMNRWFWAFGSGGRMCVGSNLAMFDMKAIIVAIWSSFTTEVIDDMGMVHSGGYVAGPIGKDGRVLLLRVKASETSG